MSKIIEITPDMERRIAARRQSDVSTRAKAERFDQLILDAHFQWEHYSKLAHEAERTVMMPSGQPPRTAAYYRAKAEAFAAILFYADIKPECKCAQCTDERMGIKEQQVSALKTVAAMIEAHNNREPLSKE